MRVKPAAKPGEATVELAPTDDQLVERSAHSPKAIRGPLKISKILVPVDFSECSLHALDYALAFAEQFEARLVLLHVVEPAASADSYLSVAPVLEDTNQNIVEAGRERLETLCRRRLGNKVPFEMLVRMGRAHSEIPDTASAMGVDLIILATHGRTGLQHVLLGSTAEKVVRHAACPVLTVRGEERGVFEQH